MPAPAPAGSTPASSASAKLPVGTWVPVDIPLPFLYGAGDFVSADDGWVFGNDLRHWNGLTWQEYPSPSEMAYAVTSAKFVSADDGWAVGYNGKVFHWDGQHWTRFPAPTNDHDMLSGIAFASPQLGWAVGEATTDHPLDFKGFMLEWNGSAWVRRSSPTGSLIKAIDVLSATDGWMVGIGNVGGELFHWNGQQWQRYGEVGPEDIYFDSIDIISSDDAWMVGEIVKVGDAPGTHEGEIWHWDGQQWNKSQHTRLGLFSVSMASSDFGWAVGGKNQNGATTSDSLLLHWNGQEWTEYPISTTTPLQFVWARDTMDGWILGGGATSMTSDKYDGVAFRYRLPTATPIPSATASAMPTRTSAETPPPALTPTANPSATATVPVPTPVPLTLRGHVGPNVGQWVMVAVLLALVAMSAMALSSRRRRR